MRWPGIEPGSTAWKAAMLTTIPPSLRFFIYGGRKNILHIQIEGTYEKIATASRKKDVNISQLVLLLIYKLLFIPPATIILVKY